MMRYRTCGFVLMIVFAVTARGEEPAAPAGTVVLDTKGFWRYHLTTRQPVMGTAEKAEPFVIGKGKIEKGSELPDPAWPGTEFDDSRWLRLQGPFYSGDGFRQRMDVGLICLRGKFVVPDPEKAQDLTFSAAFRGGLRVYLNGTEVTRKHLRDGDIDMETLAEDYPLDTWVKPDGSIIKWGWGDPGKNKERVALRHRNTGDVTIPAKMLRKGTNVIGIEIHRSACHPDWKKVKGYYLGSWNSCGISRMELKSPVADAVIPNRERPKGTQLWNLSAAEGVLEHHYGDPTDTLNPLRLVGARNGAFSAQVILSFDEKKKGVAATISELKIADGDAVISASAVEIRYGLPTGKGGAFDGLVPTPRDEGQNHPIWITVTIPKDAAPGDYEGALTVGEREVPVHLIVCDWDIPDPVDWITWVDFVQSPESVALKYDVPFWSDKHFELMGKSFEQLGRLGNATLYIPLMCQTHFGNSESMVRWIAQDPGELNKTAPTFTHDFSIAERYLDLCIEKMQKPTRIILYIYEGMLGGSQGRTAEACQRGVPFTLLDPKTKEVTTAAGPCHNNMNPAYPNFPDDTKAFWGPVLEGMRKIINERGIKDDAICIGLHPDLRPGKATFNYLKELVPWCRWAEQSHGRSGPPTYGYSTQVWTARRWENQPGRRRYGWKRTSCIQAHFDRDIWKAAYSEQLVKARLLGEGNITGTQNGFGRMSADLWRCIKGSKGQLYALPNRYRLSNWAQLTLRMTPFLYAGPEGALRTIRFEALREGVQECEARIFIEKALIGKKLEDGLAKKVQDVLDERVATFGSRSFHRAAVSWPDMSMKLYSAAAEVAKALKGGTDEAPKDN